jgi:hypothetical protein
VGIAPNAQILEGFVERETGLEPATSSLGKRYHIVY